MISQVEIISTLEPLNGIYFNILDLHEYAKKISVFGKCIDLRHEHTNELLSYILYYDNGPEVFITMVWTRPKYQGHGFAKRLLRQLIHSSSKDIRLEVHKDNHAIHIYESIGFVLEEMSGDNYFMCRKKKIAIMQPYIFPYIGYFHLIEASDLFVFYDDVHYIKQGWINRNRILMNGKDHLFTVPVSKASSTRLINETLITIDDLWRNKFYKTLTQSYRKAPYFSHVVDMIMSVYCAQECSASDLAINSIANIYNYLGKQLNHTKSSVCSPQTKGLNKADRLIQISKSQGYKMYINPAGGVNLYNKDYFRSKGIELGFISSEIIKYQQYSNDFVPSLSIIDMMMFNDREAINGFFAEYRIE